MLLLNLPLNAFTFPAPRLLKADMSVGFLMSQPIIFVAVLFFGIWIIEALIIRKKLGGSPEKILSASFGVNLITTLLGALIFIFDIPEHLLNIFNNLPELCGSIAFIGSPLLLSIIVEGILLLFFYTEKSWKEVFKTSIRMNIWSYLFTAVLLLLDIGLIFIFPFLAVFIPWCLIKFFNILSEREKLSRNDKILIAILSVILIVIIIFGGFLGASTYENSARSRARDVRRKSDLREISLAMEMYYDEHKKYLQSEVMPVAIDDYLNPVPTDPYDNSPYHWISNMDDPQKYCVWTPLDNGKFFAASHKGTREIDNAPNNLDCY